MNAVKAFLDFNLSRVKSIADIAGAVGISSETLRKAFLRQEKMHLTEYINRMRVDVMKEYLRIGNETCFNICYTVGLREDSGAKLFKKMTGMTMQQYREKYLMVSNPPADPPAPKLINSHDLIKEFARNNSSETDR